MLHTGFLRNICSVNAKIETTDADKRFGITGVINSINDFPKSGSSFGVTNTGFVLYAGFSIPAYTRLIFINYGEYSDGALLGVTTGGDILVAFRNGNVWRHGRML